MLHNKAVRKPSSEKAALIPCRVMAFMAGLSARVKNFALKMQRCVHQFQRPLHYLTKIQALAQRWYIGRAATLSSDIRLNFRVLCLSLKKRPEQSARFLPKVSLIEPSKRSPKGSSTPSI